MFYEEAITALKAIQAQVHTSLKGKLGEKPSADALAQNQQALHGFAWLASLVAAAEAMAQNATQHTENTNLARYGIASVVQEVTGGIAMSQSERVTLEAMGADQAAIKAFVDATAHIRPTQEVAVAITETLKKRQFGNYGDDETLKMVRDQFHRFSEEKVIPHCHEWHLKDTLIPMEIIEEMGQLGVFGVTVAEKYGGLAMDKTAMCVITEELSRGLLTVGSLGTRADIACELIAIGGTETQKQEWLPKLASGEVLAAAVFTEPNIGSDLGSLQTRATKTSDGWSISGAKTWTTHGARSDLMMVLARTDPKDKSWRGLSMFLGPKTRGDDANPFPDKSISGSEIEVLGYRGMKEYEIALDEYKVGNNALLGEAEGQGFKQLMATFESARIQTAARAVGVAQSALETALTYATERKQFGSELIAFPRIFTKLARMASETMLVRQLTYSAARKKSEGSRSDIEAGMAKLLAARAAWLAGDDGLQIHGGNGYALEYPISRIFCDARILNIFEGAAEIQAQIIARGLLARSG